MQLKSTAEKKVLAVERHSENTLNILYCDIV